MLTIPQLPSTTPTLAETMRTCLLWAGLSRAHGNQPYVLGNPKAWLGTAYHEVLEALPASASGGAGTALLQRAEARWNQAVARLEEAAARHPLNHRFGSATTWRGYYLVLETLRLRMAELAGTFGTGKPSGTGESKTWALREEECSALSGKLRGRIDLVRGDALIDFKTGALYEPEDADAPPSLKAGYVRQLRIYAYLVYAATGWRPRRGLLYPLAGPPVEVDLEASACEAEAAEAVRRLEQYNSAVAGGGDLKRLASPSAEACRWCPFKTICPAFWTSADESWAGTLDGEAVAGRLTKPPQAVHGGVAWSVAFAVDAGTEAHQEIVIAPLSAAVHPSIPQLYQGARVRIVGLGRRSNGALFPTQRTIMLPEADAPTLQLAASPIGSATTKLAFDAPQEGEEKMVSPMTVTCCCCKKKVQLEANPPEPLAELAGWVSIDKKPVCSDCLALFTEEDWEWCTQPPRPLGLSEIARLMPGDTEPL